MAEARRRHFNLDLASPRRGEVKLDHFKRLQLRIGRRKAGMAKNGGLNAHGIRSRNRKPPMLGEICRWGNWKIRPLWSPLLRRECARAT